MKKAPLERYIVPLLKSAVFLYEEPTAKLASKGSVMLPDGRKVNIVVNRRHKAASLFAEDLKEATIVENLSPVLSMHFGRTSKLFYGLVISDMRAFIADWHLHGGVQSVLPALRRFAGQY
jgi:hypothetical protein